jgi:P27 family predicted phage terminase small subunit
MARPRTSNAYKDLTGTYRSDRAHPQTASERLAQCPQPPTDLSDVARSEWERLAAAAHEIGTLTAADLRAFRLLCETLATAAEAQGVIGREGMTLPTGSGGTRAHPATKVLETARAQAARLLAEFGMTPRGRNYVGAAPARAEEDELERFLRGY